MVRKAPEPSPEEGALVAVCSLSPEKPDQPVGIFLVSTYTAVPVGPALGAGAGAGAGTGLATGGLSATASATDEPPPHADIEAATVSERTRRKRFAVEVSKQLFLPAQHPRGPTNEPHSFP